MDIMCATCHTTWRHHRLTKFQHFLRVGDYSGTATTMSLLNKKFLHDLKCTINQCIAQQTKLVWSRMQTILSHHKSNINKLLLDTNLTPIHTLFPNVPCTRGSSCVDLIYSTQGIQNATTASGGYLFFYEGVWIFHHRGFFVDIDTSSLHYGTRPHNIMEKTRKISNNTMSHVLQFSVWAYTRKNSVLRQEVVWWRVLRQLGQNANDFCENVIIATIWWIWLSWLVTRDWDSTRIVSDW
jgi:hypothetical protein